MRLRIKYKLQEAEYIEMLDLTASVIRLELLQKALHFEIIEYIEG